MIKIQRILCPTALSTASDEALLYGLGLARGYEAQLIVCYCGSKEELRIAKKLSDDLSVGPSRGQAIDLFEQALDRYLPADAEIPDWKSVIVEGEDVGNAITQTARDYSAELIVMRSRRRPHRAALLGSSAETVCRTAPCPVLVTHSDEREWIDQATGEIRLKRLLVAYDFSDYSELALKYALSLAQQYQAELHILHILPPRSLNEPEIAWGPSGRDTAYHSAARRLQNAIPSEAFLWCTIRHIVVEGHPYREILNYAEKNKIDLISLGAHGAGFGMKALFGSNVDRVLRQAPCPVLVARPLKPAIDKGLFVEERER